MDEVIERAALRVIENMHENLGEPITIDDMARVAMFSKFHFSRVFQRVTGLSPGRFLSAVRLREAKRLLASTVMSVTNISHQVGYSSVGTFSSRFTSSVGLSPSRYRVLGSVTPQLLAAGPGATPSGATATIAGEISSPLPDRPVFAGLFPERILGGRPVCYTLLDRPGPYVLENVPPGRWHLIAQSAAEGHEDAFGTPGGEDEAQCISCSGPITVRPGAGAQVADVRLRPMRPLDPPVLLALRDLLSPVGAARQAC
ncbi:MULTISPECIES: AraC family transcriptional regulator [unclassified Microbispora]|uniref:helix-turn-helix domain-containing protein n=1 Tax=unclassified Microbispora TaxID=2614687 RepID=UPI00147624D4|nr:MULTISPECIES: AraC family transcriptional regulator [unclassified Microbispora]